MPTPSDEEEDNILFIQIDPDRQDTPPLVSPNSSSPSSSSQSSSPSSSPSHVSLSASSQTEKPPNPRLLSFLLQALVMALAISLFFLFVGIAALLLLHICLACRALRRYRLHRSHRPQRPDYRPDLPSGLSLKALQNLPCFDRGAAGPASDCAVCLDSLREGDRCRLLPGCNHAFHAVCVDTWLVRVPACPICRAGVIEVRDQEIRAS